MHDSELKNLLLETCPIRPGQEGRAWAALRDELNRAGRLRSQVSWLYYPTWQVFAIVMVVVVALVSLLGGFVAATLEPISVATADSQSPGIYATAFYSRPAQAQVVWLNGMEPASDKPTYLDPTTVVAGSTGTPAPVNEPNSL